MPDLSVLFCTEGTYPFVGGGVSTWSEILLRNLTEAEFTIFAVTGTPEVTLRYQPPPNVRGVIHVAQWGVAEPRVQLDPDVRVGEIARLRRETTPEAIETRFVPLLRNLVRGVNDPVGEARACGSVVYGLWQYFQEHDWNASWKSKEAWVAFCDEVLAPYRQRPEEFLPHEPPSLFDLTTGLRWLYSFLMPLSAPLPRTDLVHATIAGYAALPAIVAKHEHGTPFLLTEHGVSVRERYIAVSEGPFTPFGKRFLLGLASVVARLLYLYADVVSPVANFNRRWETLYGTEVEKIETIYNGVDPEVFVPRPKPPHTAGRPTAVAAARVIPVKDIETMIRAAAVARMAVPNVRFLVYGSLDGDPPYVERCRALVSELGLEGVFELAGFHSNPAEVYAEGDISVLSSISEGFPYTVLESMACARPVAGTDVGGVREALEGFGIVVAPRDPEALGRAIATLLLDDELRLELGRRGREEVLARFRITRSVEAYRALYRRLAARPPEERAA